MRELEGSNLLQPEGDVENVDKHPFFIRPSVMESLIVPLAQLQDAVPNCRLSVIHLDDEDAPTYEALSYTWEASDTELYEDIEHQYIVLNDACVHVRPNLWDALLALMQAKSSRMLWVDALCINQEDEEEKARQILFMAQIYRHAERVVVWLGDTINITTGEDATVAFQSLLEQTTGTEDCLIPPETIDLDPSLHIGEGRLCRLPPESIEALDYWISSRYWRRIWVVQELVSARALTLQLGELAIEWNIIRKATSKINSHLSSHCCRAILWQRSRADTIAYTNLKQFVRAISDVENTRTICENGSNLETQLRLHSARLATKPQDMVFALVGLVTDWGSGAPIEPNYQIKPRIAICDAIRHIIDIHASLSILCGDYNREGVHSDTNVHITTLETLNPPSWALCFAASSEDVSAHGDFFSSPRLAHLDLYKASLDIKPSVRLTNRRDILRIEGIIFDRVAICANTRLKAGAVGEVYMKASLSLALENNAEQVQTWFNLSRKFFADFDYRATHEVWRQAFIRTVNCDVIYQDGRYIRTRSRSKSSPPPPTPDSSSVPTTDKLLVRGKSAASDSLKHRNRQDHHNQGSADFRSVARSPSNQKSRSTWEVYGPFALNREFFITERGYLGVGPASMVQGDVIVLLFGGTVPFVLRTTSPEHPHQYQLLGDCYCHGIMDGEALTDRSTKSTWFELV